MRKILISAWMICACLAVALAVAHADTSAVGPPVPAPVSSVAHPSPPALTPVAPDEDADTSTPVLAPAPDAKVSNNVGSVTCFACPEGQDYYHGSICMDGVACAAEGVTLQQLNIGVGKGNAALTEALHKLAAARVALTKTDKQSRAKALQYINGAASDLKTAGLKAACTKH
jgi:hypothetical protein